MIKCLCHSFYRVDHLTYQSIQPYIHPFIHTYLPIYIHIYIYIHRRKYIRSRVQTVWEMKKECDKQVPFRPSINLRNTPKWPIPVAARSKACVCGFWLAGIVGSNPTRDMNIGCLSLVECCVLSCLSVVRRCRTEFGVSNKCNLEAS